LLQKSRKTLHTIRREEVEGIRVHLLDERRATDDRNARLKVIDFMETSNDITARLLQLYTARCCPTTIAHEEMSASVGSEF